MSGRSDTERKPAREFRYEHDPRMPIVRRFLWKEVLDDTQDGRAGDMIYWIWADQLLAAIDAAMDAEERG